MNQVKNFIFLPEQDGPSDLQLTMMIGAVSQAIEGYCRRQFGRSTHTEWYSGGSSKLLLRNFPVQQIVRVTTLAGQEITSYELLADTGELVLAEGWPSGEDNIKIEYEAGYVTPDQATETLAANLPESIELACIRYVQMLYEGQIGKVSERLGDYAVTYPEHSAGKLPAVVTQLLEPALGRWL
ncbi:head-tail connector protein [Paenibacillus selenitireducens]|uniref:hypothetical protein n=1 Tax=Paenibacillus selenitireducens TaxID=1324314 RepID=UPI000995EFAA|nr:hypothetical protein [Paenibacillus selenitireducens]